MSFTPRSASIASTVATTVTAFNLTIQTGDLIVLTIQEQAGVPTGITDDAGNTYLKAGSTMDSPVSALAQKRVAIYYCLSSIGAVTQVTVTGGSISAIGCGVDAYDYDGVCTFVDCQIGSSSTTHPAAVTPASVPGDAIFGAIAYNEVTAGTRLESLDSGNYTETAGLNPSGSTSRVSRANDISSVGTNQPGPTWSFTSGTTASITASFRSTSNSAPTANPGPDQTVTPDTDFTLTGSGTDTDGTIANYIWTQTSGPTIPLTGTGASRTGTSPNLEAGAVCVFSLTVVDDDGANSPAATMTLTVEPATYFFAGTSAWVPISRTAL